MNSIESITLTEISIDKEPHLGFVYIHLLLV